MDRRNYDEIIADMLRSIDRHQADLVVHTQELAAIKKEQVEYTKELIAVRNQHAEQAKELSVIRTEQTLANLRIFEKLERTEKEHEHVHDQLLSQIVNSATILDRIIRKNDLKL